MRIPAAVLVLAAGVLGVWGHTHSPGYFPDHLYVEPGVVAEFAIIAGLVVCLYGFRLLRVMVFLCGFLITGLLTSAAFEHTFGLKTWVLAASWIGFMVMGIAGGCVALAVFPLGVFLVGSMLMYAFTSSFPYRMLPGESSAVLDGAVVLLGGMLSWLLVRPFTIVASSLIGSIAAIWGIGYFAGGYPSRNDMEHLCSHTRGLNAWLHTVPGSWWLYLAAIVVGFVVGITKQCHDLRKTRSPRHIGNYTGWRSSPNTFFP